MSTECARCKTANPDGAKFCAECGNTLAPQAVAFQEFLDSTLEDRVKEIFYKNYRDQKVVEIETTQAIADRFLGWSKLLGVVAGIPIALLLVVLSVLGIKTYADFTKQVNNVRAEVTADLTAARDNAVKLKQDGDKLKQDGEALASDYQKLRDKFADTAALGEQVKNLSEKVAVLERLARFQTYITALGRVDAPQMAGAFTMLRIFTNGDVHASVVDHRRANDVVARRLVQRVMRCLRIAVELPQQFRVAFAISLGGEAINPSIATAKNHLRRSAQDGICRRRPLAVQNVEAR